MSTQYFIKTNAGVVPINIGDFTTLNGVATSITGFGPSALVTALLITGDSITFKASDAYTPEGNGPAVNYLGKRYDVGAQVSVPAQITTLTTTGETSATIAVTLYSLTVVDITGTQKENFVTGDFVGDLTGNVTGNLTGDVVGDVTGNVTGDLAGDVTGNLSGNVTSTGTSQFNIATAAKLNNVRVVDGVNFTTIQAAVNDLPAGGGTVFVPQGTYVISAQISLPNAGVSIVGAGVGATIIQTSYTAGYSFLINNHDNCRLSDFTLVQTSTGGGGILINGSQQSVVERVIMHGAFNNGLTLNVNVTESTIFCAFRQLLVYNINAGGTCYMLDTGTSTLNSIGSNVFENCNGNFNTNGIGFHIAGTGVGAPFVYTNFFVGCECYSVDGTGTCFQLDASAGRGNTFVGCFAESAATGISIASGSQSTYWLNGAISGNTTNVTDNGTNTWIQSFVGAVNQISALDDAGNLKINGIGLAGAGATTNNINGTAGMALEISGSTVVQLQSNRAEFKRIDTDLQTNVVTGDFAISAGWGSTGSKSAISGKDQNGTITVTPSGSGIAANPTVTLTFHDGAWSNGTPIVVATRCDIQTPTTGWWAVTSVSATQAVFTFVGTPSTGLAYILNWNAMGI